MAEFRERGGPCSDPNDCNYTRADWPRPLIAPIRVFACKHGSAGFTQARCQSAIAAAAPRGRVNLARRRCFMIRRRPQQHGGLSVLTLAEDPRRSGHLDFFSFFFRGLRLPFPLSPYQRENRRFSRDQREKKEEGGEKNAAPVHINVLCIIIMV